MSNQSTTAEPSPATDRPTTEPSATADQATTCPLCTFGGDTQTDVYTHLLTSHRKSAITSALLDRHPVYTTRWTDDD